MGEVTGTIQAEERKVREGGRRRGAGGNALDVGLVLEEGHA